ncbi:MAG: DNA translocase FtsK [Eubacterium sp.]|nr:DNA translocase FtsK [Eubacterium sp.]
MATQKKSTTAKRTGTSSGRKTTSTRRKSSARKKPTEQEVRLRQEVILLIILALSIVLLLSNFGLGGVVGRALSSFFFGLFGLPAYIFPILLFIGFIFALSNRDNPKFIRKLIGASGLYIFICALLQLLMTGYDKNARFRDLYLDSAYDRMGGGLFGGLIVKLFGRLFGTVGAFILVVAALIIFAIIMTQEPLLNIMRQRSSSAYQRAAERRRRRAEEAAEAEAEADAYDDAYDTDSEADEEDAAEAETKTVRRSGRKKASPVTLTRKTRKKPVRDYEEDAEEDLGPAPELIQTRRISGASDSDEPVVVRAPRPKSAEDLRVEQELANLDHILGISGSDEDDSQADPDPYDLSGMPDDETPVSSAPVKRTRRTAAAAGSGAELAASYLEEAAGSGSRMQTRRKSSSARTSEKNDADAGPVELVIPEESEPHAEYQFPTLDLLNKGTGGRNGETTAQLNETASKLQRTLHNFGVEVQITDISCGPSVTRYELHPEMGVKVSRILSLQDDIKLNLAAADIRIEAPIPGKSAIGIEVPNKVKSTVTLRDMLESRPYQSSRAELVFAVGMDIAGKPVVTDIAKMPHLLIAGATGSGKSVCINTLIVSLLYKISPDDLKFIMIDPKKVELSVYNGIPHLMIPVVDDPKKAAGALNWAVNEMMSRYDKFAAMKVRDLNAYNEKLQHMQQEGEGGETLTKMPRIVIIVDELADLMMVAQKEVEDAIVRLSQLARAAGIHLVIATQRPSVNVITGLIKANMPSRIALAVSSGVDSRTIIDMNGAEKLLGHGDMLFYPQGYQKPARVQGAFVSDDEINNLVNFLKKENEPSVYDQEAEKKITLSASVSDSSGGGSSDDRDMYFADAGKLIIEKNKASIGMLQRAFKIGFNRAARIMDQLCDAGVVGEEEGTKPRKILMTMDEFLQILDE